MALLFREAHATADKKQINGEWFVLENAGASSVSTAGLQVISGRKGKRGSVLGIIDPGFMLQPGEKILVVSGIPGKKSHGDPPEREGMRTYHLFQKQPLLQGDGTIIRLAMNQLEVARFVYDRNAPSGVAKSEDEETRSNGGAFAQVPARYPAHARRRRGEEAHRRSDRQAVERLRRVVHRGRATTSSRYRARGSTRASRWSRRASASISTSASS